MSTPQFSKNLLRKSAKTCDKSNKPKNTVTTTKFVHTFTVIILSNILSLICIKMSSTEVELEL